MPVYYISRALHGVDLRYPPMEKLVYTLVTMTRRLRSYFQAHTIVVLTNQPLRVVLQKSKVSGCMVKWEVELGELDIHYHLRVAII